MLGGHSGPRGGGASWASWGLPSKSRCPQRPSQGAAGASPRPHSHRRPGEASEAPLPPVLRLFYCRKEENGVFLYK